MLIMNTGVDNIHSINIRIFQYGVKCEKSIFTFRTEFIIIEYKRMERYAKKKGKVMMKGNSNQKNNQKYNKKQDRKQNTKSRAWQLLPLHFVLALLPLVTYYYYGHSGYTVYSWNSITDEYHDFFLHYKMIAFVAVAVVMLAGVILKLKKQGFKNLKKQLLCFVPFGIYLVSLILSTAFSNDYKLSFLGAMDQKEPFFVLFGYVITALYAYLVIETEADLHQLSLSATCGASAMAILGVLQAVGKDPFQTLSVQKMIADNSVLEQYGQFTLTFPKGVAYGTLFNPNYVGTYVSMYLPLLLFGVLCGRALWQKILSAAAMLGLLVMLFASRSRTGLIAVIAVLFMLLVFSMKYVIKWWYLIIPALTFGIVVFLNMDALNDSVLTNRLIGMFRVEKEDYVLKGIDTTKNSVTVRYKDTEFSVMMPVAGDGFAYLVLEQRRAGSNHLFGGQGMGVFHTGKR